VAGALSLGAFFLAFFLLPETLRGDTTGLRRGWLDWGSMRRVLRTPDIGLLVATFSFATIAFGGLESTLSLLNQYLLDPPSQNETTAPTATPLPQNDAADTPKRTEKTNFLVFADIGLVLMLTQGFFYRRFVQRVGEVRFMRAGVALMALGLALAVLVALEARPGSALDRQAVWVSALTVMTITVVGFALLTPSVQSLISRRADPSKQGEVLGVNQSVSALARILGPSIGLPLFKASSTHVLPYACGAALLCLAFFFTLRIHQD
jgi:MFS family permease